MHDDCPDNGECIAEVLTQHGTCRFCGKPFKANGYLSMRLRENPELGMCGKCMIEGKDLKEGN